MTKRRITSHKGGRTARAPEARIRPQTLERIHEAMREQGKSWADLVEEKYGGNDMPSKTPKMGKRQIVVELVREECINQRQNPDDLDSSAAVGLLDDMCHTKPDSPAVKWYLKASDRQIDLFEEDWNLYGH